jgi:hypothetical protein
MEGQPWHSVLLPLEFGQRLVTVGQVPQVHIARVVAGSGVQQKWILVLVGPGMEALEWHQGNAKNL